VAAIVGLTVAAVYMTLVVFLRIQGDLFPGNETLIGALPVHLPQTDIGTDIHFPGVSTRTDPAWTSASRLNVLVLGLDRRPDDPPDEPSRSDTMFVASIDKQDNRLQLLAIPRDLWTDVPYGSTPGEWAQAKINAAYSYGGFYHYEGGAAAAAVAAVQHDFNIRIDHYVVIDWVGFVQLVDAFGGMDIDVPETISDFGTDVLDVFPNNTVQAGQQHMDGKQALGYSRVRVDGDIKRIERQQLVIRTLATRSVSLGYITKLPELWDAYHAAIKTDVETGQIIPLATLAQSLKLDNIETFSLAPATYSGISDDGQLILLPNQDQVYEIIDRFMADPKLRDEAPVIAIEYPPGLDDQAKKARDHMVTYGVPIAWIKLVKGASDVSAPGIYDLTTKSYTAEKMTELFDLRLLDPDAAASATPGADVLVRLADGTELRSP
jgi:polyisoprenyl-teichoic acid--peptidoglycan teichoic acid transferase